MKEQPQNFERFGAQWTPTILVAESDGTERHRIEGFLPKEDFVAQLRLGLAHAARARSDFKEAQRRFRELSRDESLGEVAAEAQYWEGVAKYKDTNDPVALQETARAFKTRFTGSPWAKKASVWG